MITVFVAGIILVLTSGQAFGSLKKSCRHDIMRSGMTTMMTIGAIFITIPITYIMCKATMKCHTSTDEEPRIMVYMVIVALFNITMIVLCTIMINKLKRDSDKKVCGGKKVKGTIWILLMVNVLLFIGIVTGLIILNKDIIFYKY
jgi:heme/copper-type cytochrome/quinol oxidase subunit 2